MSVAIVPNNHHIENNSKDKFSSQRNGIIQQQQQQLTNHCYNNPENWLKIAILIIVVSVFTACLTHPTLSIMLLTNFLSWVEKNPWNGACVFIFVYIINNIFLVPGLILSTGAGYIYAQSMGIWPGTFFATFITLIACFFGSSISFLNGRYLLRKVVRNFVSKSPTFVMIDYAVKKHGVKVTFLFRLSPGTPYCYFNYIMGCTSVRFVDYMIGAVGMFPNIFSYCFVGASVEHIYELSSLNPRSNELILVLTVTGLVLIIVTFFYIAWIAKKEIKKLSDEMDEEQLRLQNRCILEEEQHEQSVEMTSCNGNIVIDDDMVFKDVIDVDSGSDINLLIIEVEEDEEKQSETDI